ncbi:thiamine monophosphate synthase [Variovorax sp. Sphag1AA]|nr:thiamine monophosphate synthase [Variovorax sp. Sphag1AA]
MNSPPASPTSCGSDTPFPGATPAARKSRFRGVSGLARAGWLALGGIALAGVFALYAQPAFVVTMIDQLWACF